MKFKLLILIFCSIVSIPAVANANSCLRSDISEKKPGLYYLTSCQSGECLEKAARFSANKINKSEFELVFISGNAQASERLAILQLRYKNVTPDKLDRHQSVGDFVNIFRDKIEFLCDDETDNSDIVGRENSIAIPSDEYDSYHRYFTVRDDAIGPVLRRQFHAKIKQSGSSCVRTDSFSTRFLFLLGERLRDRDKFSQFFKRIGIGSTSAYADSEEVEFTEVSMKVKSSGDTSFGCFSSKTKMIGAELKVEATDIQEHLANKLLRPDGVFSEAKFVLSDN